MKSLHVSFLFQSDRLSTSCTSCKFALARLSCRHWNLSFCFKTFTKCRRIRSIIIQVKQIYILSLFEFVFLFFSSIYGSAIFNFGTVLVMSIVRSIFPQNDALRFGVGLFSSSAILFIGRRYIQYIDQIFDAIRFRAITRS